MKLFENRILYSFYCFEQWIDGSFHMLFRGVKVWSMKKMYNLNPFGYIKNETNLWTNISIMFIWLLMRLLEI